MATRTEKNWGGRGGGGGDDDDDDDEENRDWMILEHLTVQVQQGIQASCSQNWLWMNNTPECWAPLNFALS